MDVKINGLNIGKMTNKYIIFFYIYLFVIEEELRNCTKESKYGSI
jgi:hypothetical protein